MLRCAYFVTALLVIVSLAGVGAATEKACAGAFMLPEGTGQFIAGVGYSQGSRRFDPSGNAVPAPADAKAEASGYLEYGLPAELTLVLAPTLEHPFDAAASNTITGSQSSAFGARVLLFGTPTRVVAVQALVEPFVHGATDVRLMLGQGFPLFGWPAFVDIEPGARVRPEPEPTEGRLDVAFGIRPRERLLLLAQDFASFAHSRGPTIPFQSYSKLQLSAVYDVSRRWSLQLGAFQTLAGRNIVRERGPFVAVWIRL